MTFRQELSSWFAPASLALAPAPELNTKAPSTVQLQIPASDRKPIIVAFLRHCGCPFAEATFLNLRRTAEAHPNIYCIAISHSSSESTATWLSSIGGSTLSNLKIIIDADREIYAQWGLGSSGWLHVLYPPSMYAAVKLGREKGIWNRPTESGSRWQTGGAWAVDGEGVVRWGGVARGADEVPEFEEAVEAVSAQRRESAKL